MKLILADNSKSKKIEIDDSKVLNHLIHMENKIAELKKNKKVLVKSTMNYTLQVQMPVFCTVYVKSTKVLLMRSQPFVEYCQL